MTTLVEACAGGAGLTVRCLLGPKAKSPFKYLGNKLPFADQILDAWSAPRAFDRYVLIDPGLPGAVWGMLRDYGQDTLDAMGAWREEKGETLWRRLAAEPMPTEHGAFAATYLVLQAGAANSKPVALRPDGTWRTAGYGSLSPTAVRKGFSDRVVVEKLLGQTTALVEALRTTNIEVYFDRAEDVLEHLEVDADMYVYFDPDYEGTTGYWHKLERQKLVKLAGDTRDRGARVALSEGVSLAHLFPGSASSVLKRTGWQSARFSKKTEHLTVLDTSPQPR